MVRRRHAAGDVAAGIANSDFARPWDGREEAADGVS